jgi:hypothetical protein
VHCEVDVVAHEPLPLEQAGPAHQKIEASEMLGRIVLALEELGHAAITRAARVPARDRQTETDRLRRDRRNNPVNGRRKP